MTSPERDSLTFRRWPTGITGIPRLREWDAVVVLELPELEGTTLEELDLFATAAAGVEVTAAEGVPGGVVERVASELDARVERPYRALVVRRDRRRWSAGARAVRGETIALPPGLPAASLEVVSAPDDDVQVLADGEPMAPAVAEPVAAAVAELEARARARFEFFVARADRVGDRTWQLTVDPL